MKLYIIYVIIGIETQYKVYYDKGDDRDEIVFRSK